MTLLNRRELLAATVAGTGALRAFAGSGAGMRLGLVTYQWGKDMDLPTLIDVCEKSGVLGLELRTQHAHKVEPDLTKAQRTEVKKRFADSPVTLVGYGSNAEYHAADPQVVKENIELTKKYVDLMADCGSTGVKVKPNGFPEGVSREKTIEQIGKALNVVGKYSAEKGQQIRVEVHGRGTSEVPVMKAIFDVADHPNVKVCWNSNDVDLEGQGLEHNFNLVKDRFGDTVHIRELNVGGYPYADLMKLFVNMSYKGWLLLEARTEQPDKVAALKEQLAVFKKMVA
jgi:sugar phosphate isomerase/epimerase